MITLDSIILPDMIWSDEFTWRPVWQRTERTLTQKLFIETGPIHKGRPVTLTDAWVTRATLQQLQTLASTPGTTHTLTLQGQTYTVAWRHTEQALTAEPIKPVTDPDDDDFYSLILRLMVVA
ncbi:hypothetical protein [Nitrincola iocasae]|uniref:Uncharacterized protein n=1 Tax=Nitrincola iocasae TaxID=2614693 RepID=A0A5J6LBK5_9GAMM|nr:hypothetical protein [Nitrincola iocasae]QEW05658.1 hypothetical protein F5I99_03660 [Nitrincola iocasae]